MQFTILIATFILVAASVSTARPGPAAAANAPSVDELQTCIIHYNDLVLRAKKSLSDGDRNRAISLLIEAHSQLGRCEEIRDQSLAKSVRLRLNQRELSTVGSASSCALN
jgi:hypothetical protein